MLLHLEEYVMRVTDRSGLLPWMTLMLAFAVMAWGGQAWAQVQTGAQQKCTVGMNKALSKKARAHAKIIERCVKNFGRENQLAHPPPLIDTLEECIVHDRKGKIAKARARSISTFAKHCNGVDGDQVPRLPPYGVTDPNGVNAAALIKELDLIHDIFGSDLDAPGAVVQISAQGEAKRAVRCQRKVLHAVVRCQASKLRAFIGCKNRGLRGKTPPGAIASAADMETICLMQGGDPTTGQPDDRDKIARSCTDPRRGIPRDVERRCDPSNLDRTLSELFTPCGTDDPTTLAACLEAAVECRFCRAVNQADDLNRDCDLFDNGAADASCP